MWTSRILRCHAQQAGWTAVVDTSKLSARLGEILSSSPRQSTFDLRPTLFRSAAQCVPHVQRHLRSHLACSAQQSQCPAADGHSGPGSRRSTPFEQQILDGSIASQFTGRSVSECPTLPSCPRRTPNERCSNAHQADHHRRGRGKLDAGWLDGGCCGSHLYFHSQRLLPR